MSIEELHTIFSQLKEICNDIITCPVLKLITNEKSTLIEDLAEETEKSTIIIKNDFSDFVMKFIVRTAKIVLMELPYFSKMSGTTIGVDNPNVTLLREVWYGDAYDVQELDGLMALARELTEKYNILQDTALLVEEFRSSVKY